MSRNRGVTKAHVARRERLIGFIRTLAHRRHNRDWKTAREWSELACYFDPRDGFHRVYIYAGSRSSAERCENDLKVIQKEGRVESSGERPRLWRLAEK